MNVIFTTEHITVVPFLPEHLEKVLSQHPVESGFLEEGITPQDAAEGFIKAGPSYTGLYEDVIIGCAGLIILRPGVAHAWAIFDTGPLQLIPHREVFQVIGGMFPTLLTHFKIRRVQADCNTENPVFSHFLESLGFQKEGVMRKFGQGGKDHFLYSIVREV